MASLSIAYFSVVVHGDYCFDDDSLAGSQPTEKSVMARITVLKCGRHRHDSEGAHGKGPTDKSTYSFPYISGLPWCGAAKQLQSCSIREFSGRKMLHGFLTPDREENL
jgi:hypothetical protein